VYSCLCVQIDLEMAFADGETVMQRVEQLVKSVYKHAEGLDGSVCKALSPSAFLRMPYNEAMSKHGSDKPDLRITPLVSARSPYSSLANSDA
jgi:aspartyl-tRNA synthetase